MNYDTHNIMSVIIKHLHPLNSKLLISYNQGGVTRSSEHMLLLYPLAFLTSSTQLQFILEFIVFTNLF